MGICGTPENSPNLIIFQFYEHATVKLGPAKKSLLDQAEQKYKEALLLEPRYYTSIANIGNVNRERAKLHLEDGKWKSFYER